MYSIHDELPPPAASLATASEVAGVAEAAPGMFCLKKLPSSEVAATTSSLCATRTTTLASTTVVTVMPKEGDNSADPAEKLDFTTASNRLPTGLHNTNRRRSSTIRRSKTVEPPTNSEISNRFDVTRASVELNRSKSETHQDDPDLEAMVRGGVRVASVSSKVAAECGTTASIRFATTTASDTDTSRLGCDSLKSKVSTEASIASEVKLRFSTAWWWILGHCLKCARRVRLTTKTELELRSKMTSGSTKRASSIDDADGDGLQKYWGPLISQGGNGPSAKPLFTSFKTEGHVSTACLWHACRAVTVGSLLIILGITMAVLGFIADQKTHIEKLRNSTQGDTSLVGPGMAEPVDRFKLNNLSFAGPIIMGVGGFLIVAACVMTFEARDSAAKVVPATTANNVDENVTAQKESADCMALHAFSSTLASRSTTTSLTATGSVGGRKSLAVSSAGQQASASKFQQHHGDKGGTGYNNMSNMHSQFRSSSSQTTFLDRNIVQNLAVTRPGSSLAGGGGPFDQQPQSSSSKLSSVGGRTTATVATGAGGGGGGGHATRRRCRPKTVPASYTSGSGSVKRASFSGTLPDVAVIEPGLALMDEIGRRALTDAFIRFTRETAKTHRFLYNPKFDNSLGSPIEATESSQQRSTSQEDEEDEDLDHPGMPKCPSAPNIHQHKLYQPVPSMLVTPASNEGVGGVGGRGGRYSSILRSDSYNTRTSSTRVKLSLSPLPPPGEESSKKEPSSVYCYRVLTPTMYRSRMASARQAVSMDYDDDSGAVKKARLRREGPSMRGPSPLLRPGKLLKAQRSSGENSFDLELGASATRVHQQQLHTHCELMPFSNSSSSNNNQARNNRSRVSPTVQHHSLDHHSGSSMMLDLHIEGAAPVTLLVRDESRSTRSTSMNKEDDLDPLLDFQDASFSSAASPPAPPHQDKALKEHILLQRRTTSSEDDPSFDAVISGSNFERENSNSKKNNNSSKKVSTSLALQIVDSDQDNTKSGSCTSLTLAQEMASFEYIDEKTGTSVSSPSSLASDFDVWSPRVKEEDVAILEAHGGDCEEASEGEIVSEGHRHSTNNSTDLILKKQRFLTELLESKNLLSIPARRASAESLSSPLYLHEEVGDCVDKSKNNSKMMRPKQSTLPTSLSVTSELNRGGAMAMAASSSAESTSKSGSSPTPSQSTTSKEQRENSNSSSSSSHFQARKRNCQTRKSILVRQSKVDDHRQDDEDKNKPPRHD